jgi:hypothetical protein
MPGPRKPYPWRLGVVDPGMSFPKLLVRVVTAAVAVVYLASVVQAQVACPFMGCRGPGGDVWMLPLFLSLIGIPAIFSSLMFVAEWRWPRSTAVVALRYAAIAAVVLPLVGAAVLGVLGGLRAGHRP